MTLPPRRMFDVWSDPDYEFAESKPERLLLAALDYSVQRLVVYVAAKPPRSIFRSIAAHLNRKILYIPIGRYRRPSSRNCAWCTCWIATSAAKRRRIICGKCFGAAIASALAILAALGALSVLQAQRPFKEYPGREYTHFPVPPD